MVCLADCFSAISLDNIKLIRLPAILMLWYIYTLALLHNMQSCDALSLISQIKELLEELKEEHLKNPQKKQKKDPSKKKAVTMQPNKSSLKTPHRDLHLPAMSNLTKKNSSQAYFLRILKVRRLASPNWSCVHFGCELNLVQISQNTHYSCFHYVNWNWRADVYCND